MRLLRYLFSVFLAFVLVGCAQSNTVQSAEDVGGRTEVPITQLSLTPPLPNDVASKVVITEGWRYGPKETAVHGKTEHGATDWAVPYGTPVIAAADGWAIASTHLRHPGEYQGKVYGYAMGHFVEIRHDNGMATQYGHLEKIAEGIPYIEPVKKSDSWWDPEAIYVSTDQRLPNSRTPASSIVGSGGDQPAEVLTTPKRVRAGQIIGYVGTSGLSWGEIETPTSGQKKPSWDEPHVHFEVYRRGPDGAKIERIDPFDLHSANAADYQKALKGPVRGLWDGGKGGGDGIGWRSAVPLLLKAE